ncbi:MAG: TolC family protein, partial [Rhizobiaceae bacterium]
MRLVPVAVALNIALCAPAQAESIHSALASAYNHNATLNAQRAATRVADENLPQAKSGYLPQVFANADIGVSKQSAELRPNPPFNPGGRNENDLVPYGFGVTIQQSLFDGYRTINNVKAAEAGIRASRETLRNVEQDTLFNAATAYADVLQFEALVELDRSNIAFLREQVRSSQARLDVGEGTRTDLAQSQSGLAQGQALLAAQQASLGTARGTYFQVIGRQPNNLKWPKGPIHLYPPSLSQAIALAANRHPA